MSFVRNEDIIGYRTAKGDYCPSCYDKECPQTLEGMAGVITRQEQENSEGVFYCDICHEAIE